MNVSSAYAAMADIEASGHRRGAMDTMGLFDPRCAKPGFRAFQRYSKDATRDVLDGDGVMRWTTQLRARIGSAVAMAALRPGGETTMTLIAAECLTTVSTVSRTLVQLQRWGLYVVDIRRGRKGGITIHRPGWERFWESVWDLRRRLSTLKRNVARLLPAKRRGSGEGPESVAEQYQKDGTELRNRLRSRDATFSDYMAWREDRDAPEAAETR
jgi:hypothetical protein